MAGDFGGRGWEEGRVPKTSLTGLMPSLSLICFTTDRSEANRREESTDRQSRSKKGQNQRAREGAGEARRPGGVAEHQRPPAWWRGGGPDPTLIKPSPVFVPLKHSKMSRSLGSVPVLETKLVAEKQLTISNARSRWS